MTLHCRDNVGDKGQRYEVTYCDEIGQRFVFGWAETLEGTEVMEKSINLNPSMLRPIVRDRFMEEV